jgi:hypothetical protein
VHLKPLGRCHRDRKGMIRRLSAVRPKPPRFQRGLGLVLRGPRTVRPGATARFSINVSQSSRHAARPAALVVLERGRARVPQPRREAHGTAAGLHPRRQRRLALG